MTQEAMQLVIAKCLSDTAYRKRFFGDDPGAPAEHGLTADEFAILRRLDSRKLEITSEGFAGKRFERVESAFPLALHALELMDPKARARYIGRTKFPPDEVSERATFLDYLRDDLECPEHLWRLLMDLADVEILLFEAPPLGLPTYRYRPDVTRPARSPHALTVRLRGPLPNVLSAGMRTLPAAYPAAPGEHLVIRDGGRLSFESLEATGKLLEACDGTRTVNALVDAFGEKAEDVVKRWLRHQVVEDAASP